MKYFYTAFIWLLASTSVSAANVWCEGKIAGHYLAGDGSLYIKGSWRNDWTQVCNLNQSWKNISPNVCEGWLSMSQTAKVADLDVILMYSTTYQCNAMPNYSSAPAPIYIMHAP